MNYIFHWISPFNSFLKIHPVFFDEKFKFKAVHAEYETSAILVFLWISGTGSIVEKVPVVRPLITVGFFRPDL